MTDLEICKRLAEIDGLTGHEFMGVFILSSSFNEAVNESHSNSYSFNVNDYSYNPLTDDGLCFQLMVKYDLDVIAPYRKDGCTQWEVQIFHCNYSGVVSIYDESPNKAICLAIIEVNK